MTLLHLSFPSSSTLHSLTLQLTNKYTHTLQRNQGQHTLTDVCLWMENDVETKWKLHRQEDLSLPSTRDRKKKTGTKLQWLIVALILTKALSGCFVLEAQILIIDEIAVYEIRAEGTEKNCMKLCGCSEMIYIPTACVKIRASQSGA